MACKKSKAVAELDGVEPDEKYLPKVARLLARNAAHPISDKLANQVVKKTVRKVLKSRVRKWSAFEDKVSILSMTHLLN